MSPQEELSDYIRRHGLRRTFERERILQLIIEMDGHFTAQSLYERYEETGQHLSLASFYNTIEFLLKASLIVKHPFTGAEQQFELRERAEGHHHRICTECGAMKEFSDRKLARAVMGRQFNTFDTRYHSVYLYGVCSKCRNKRQGPSVKK